MLEHGSERNAESRIEAIRTKPVRQMTGKELVFIHRNGTLTLEEKKRLKSLVAQKKQHEADKASENAGNNSSLLQDAIDAVNGTYKPSDEELREVNAMMDRSRGGRFSLQAETGYDAVQALRREMGGNNMPPTAREIAEARDSALPTPKENSFFHKLRRSFVKVIHEPVFVLAIVLLIFMVLFVRPFFVPSGSMRPTLMEGDRILSIAQYFPSGSTYQRGDVVCFTAPNGTVYVKRVVGVGGDHIQISGEKVYVNGEESPYQGTGGVMTSMDVQLADDEYWVMGDNRGNSEDSRFIGPVKAENMISKVVAIYLPGEHAKFL